MRIKITYEAGPWETGNTSAQRKWWRDGEEVRGAAAASVWRQGKTMLWRVWYPGTEASAKRGSVELESELEAMEQAKRQADAALRSLSEQ